MDKIRFGHYLSKINISSESDKFLKMKAWRDKAYDFALSKLKEISIWNIIVIRTIGVHATIVAFGSGMVKGKYSNNIIANSILAILDVAFYWVLLGSGKLIFAKFFPGIDVEYYLKEYFFQTITFSLIIFYVLFFAVKLIKYRNGNKF